ncbi:OLC1v1022119C2 [Oldenlandia corymbosa var. corymbosa]|uniref:OLC1v1022119C2 n=1 Tax=Oldenlandia corymbosa var. corymbosa TaxID=529605 RepID=A0AAV1BYF5_OLDCO|nr:OLC1v1022119C2 [Oldenlandia corymbosa var. corymbosa]
MNLSLSFFVNSVARIALVKPEKARGVEDVIIRAAQMGQIAEKVSEERLITLLEQINTQTTKQTKVTVSGTLLQPDPFFLYLSLMYTGMTCYCYLSSMKLLDPTTPKCSRRRRLDWLGSACILVALLKTQPYVSCVTGLRVLCC